MDSELISPEHRRCLAWFEEHQGEVSTILGPLARGTAAGLQAEGDLQARRSAVRAQQDQPRQLVGGRRAGAWLLSYHQENADPADWDRKLGARPSRS